MSTNLEDKEMEQMREAIRGLYPDKCNLLTPTRTTDGAGGYTEAWGTATRNVPCRLDQVSGSERLADGVIRSFTSLELALPYDTTITDAYRVEHEGRTYHVLNSNLDQSWQLERLVKLEAIS